MMWNRILAVFLVMSTNRFEPVRKPRVICHNTPRAGGEALYASLEIEEKEELSSPKPAPPDPHLLLQTPHPHH
jgi:hypothetical protein